MSSINAPQSTPPMGAMGGMGGMGGLGGHPGQGLEFLGLPPPAADAQNVNIKRASIGKDDPKSEMKEFMTELLGQDAVKHVNQAAMDSLISIASELDVSAQLSANPQLADTNNPQSPVLPAIEKYSHIDMKEILQGGIGGMQAAEGGGVQAGSKTPSIVFFEALEQAMSKYSPPPTQQQLAQYVANPQHHDATLPKHVEEHVKNFVNSKTTEIMQQFGLPSNWKPQAKEEKLKTQDAPAGANIDAEQQEEAVALAQSTDSGGGAGTIAAPGNDNKTVQPTSSNKSQSQGGDDIDEELAYANAVVSQGQNKTSGKAISLSSNDVGGTKGVSQKGNPFFAGNAYVAFEIAFMDMALMLIKMKQVQGQIQISAMNTSYSLAVDMKNYIQAGAQAEADSLRVQAACEAVSLATTIVCAGMSAFGQIGESEEAGVPNEDPKLTTQEEPQQIGTKETDIEYRREWNSSHPDDPLPEHNPNDPDSFLNAQGNKPSVVEKLNQDLATKNAAIEANNLEIQKGTDKIKENQQKIEKAQNDIKSKTGSKAENERIIDKATKENSAIERNLKDPKGPEARNTQLKQEIRDLQKTAKENPINKAGSDKSYTKTKVDQMTKERTVQNETIKNGNETIKNKNADAREANEANHAKFQGQRDRNADVRARNQTKQQKWQMYSTFLQQGVSNATNIIKDLQEAEAKLQKAFYDGFQQIAGTLKDMYQKLSQSAAENFRAETDLISQTIQELNGMRSKLMDAVASMLRKSG